MRVLIFSYNLATRCYVARTVLGRNCPDKQICISHQMYTCAHKYVYTCTSMHLHTQNTHFTELYPVFCRLDGVPAVKPLRHCDRNLQESFTRGRWDNILAAGFSYIFDWSHRKKHSLQKWMKFQAWSAMKLCLGCGAPLIF